MLSVIPLLANASIVGYVDASLANTSVAGTGGAVHALQALTGGPTIEAGFVNAHDTTGAYSLLLPAGSPAKLAYAAGATTFAFAAAAADVAAPG